MEYPKMGRGGVRVGGLEGLVLRQHRDSSHQPLPMMDDSQMPVKPFFSSGANDRVMCLDLKALQGLLSKQWGAWLICSAGGKLTPETQGWLPSSLLPSTLFALPPLAVPLAGGE